MPNCVAFEFGVDYGGAGAYNPGDCQPNDSVDHTGCNGCVQNLDLYIKGGGTIASAWHSCIMSRFLCAKPLIFAIIFRSI